MGELSEQNRALIEREIGSYTDLDWNKSFHFGPQTLNDLLDAARTEGRGEGEPVAYMMKTAGSGSRPVLPSYVYAWREKVVSVDAQPLYASPIREPEISEETVKAARDLSNRLRGRYAVGPIMPNGEPEFGYRQFDKMPDGKVLPAIHGEAADMIDAILNLAPVGGRRAVSASDRAFVRHLIREMRSAIADDPNDATITTGPLDPDILERVLNVALGAQEQGGMK